MVMSNTRNGKTRFIKCLRRKRASIASILNEPQTRDIGLVTAPLDKVDRARLRFDFSKYNLSRIEPSTLGRCAVAIAGHRLGGTSLGADIDEHDTVIRFSSPPKAALRDTGRKTDVLVKRVCDLSTTIYAQKKSVFGEHTVDSDTEAKLKAYITMAKYCTKNRHNSDAWERQRVNNAFSWKGKPVLYTDVSFSRSGGMAAIYRQIVAPCIREGGTRRREASPTSGWKVLAALIESRSCASINVYGMDTVLGCLDSFDSAIPAYGYLDANTGKPVTNYGFNFRKLESIHSIDHECWWWLFYASELGGGKHFTTLRAHRVELSNHSTPGEADGPMISDRQEGGLFFAWILLFISLRIMLDCLRGCVPNSQTTYTC